jgi:hypothetical protein
MGKAVAAAHRPVANHQNEYCVPRIPPAIYFGIHGYESKYGHLPPSVTYDKTGRKMHSWRVLILPFMDDEDRDIYRRYSFDEPWDGPNNSKLMGTCPACFRCPRDPSATRDTSYLAVVGRGTIWDEFRGKPVTGAGKDVVMVLESRGKNVCWLEPRDYTKAEARAILGDTEAAAGGAGCNYSYCTWYYCSALNAASESGSARQLRTEETSREIGGALGRSRSTVWSDYMKTTVVNQLEARGQPETIRLGGVSGSRSFHFAGLGGPPSPEMKKKLNEYFGAGEGGA